MRWDPSQGRYRQDRPRGRRCRNNGPDDPRHKAHCTNITYTTNLKISRKLLMKDHLSQVPYRFSSQTPLWQVLLIWGQFGENLGRIWGQFVEKIWTKCGENFRLARNGVHPPDPLLTQFRKAPDSAELTCFCAPTCPSFA